MTGRGGGREEGRGWGGGLQGNGPEDCAGVQRTW